MLGQIVSEACRERLLAANAGKGVSPEQRAKIAAWMRRAWDRQCQRVQEAPSDIADSAEHVRRRSQIHRTWDVVKRCGDYRDLTELPTRRSDKECGIRQYVTRREMS